jgi:hypothetical protein
MRRDVQPAICGILGTVTYFQRNKRWLSVITPSLITPWPTISGDDSGAALPAGRI